MNFTVEWQVWWDAGPHVECHTFAKKVEADAFMSTFPPSDIHEGGIVHPPVPNLRKVVRHQTMPKRSDSR